MSSNYFNLTGVLVLKSVTPVVKALFSVYELDAEFPGNGLAYIANMAESTDHSWDSVMENLEALCEELGLPLTKSDGQPIDCGEDLLDILATHYKAENNEEFINLIEHGDFKEDAPLDALFIIARAFDDGHGLSAIKTEASWHCSRPELFEFGGAGYFTGTHVSLAVGSAETVSLGESLEEALANNDPVKAAKCLRVSIGSILAGINDSNARDLVRSNLMALLAESEVANHE